MELNKPSPELVEELAQDVDTKDGITAYQVTLTVNSWLKEEGLPEIKSQRVYNQFAKKVPKDEKIGSRFTERGAQILAEVTFAHMVKSAS